MTQRGGFVTGALIVMAFALALLGGVAATARAASVVVRPVANGSVFAENLGPVARIVRDAPSFDALLAEWQLQGTRARAAAVDFRRRSLIVLLDSEKPDSGYVDLVGGIDVAGRTATLTATVFRRSGIRLDAFASPWAIVSVPRAAVARAAPEVRVTLRCAANVRGCPQIGA